MVYLAIKHKGLKDRQVFETRVCYTFRTMVPLGRGYLRGYPLWSDGLGPLP